MSGTLVVNNERKAVEATLEDIASQMSFPVNERNRVAHDLCGVKGYEQLVSSSLDSGRIIKDSPITVGE